MPDLLDRLDGVTKTTKGWQARCPAHDDRTASLSVSTGDDGRWLLHCHAGPQSVVVIADNDDPGRKHLRKAAKSCDQAGLGVRVIEHLPDVPAKGDISDYLDTHSQALTKVNPECNPTIP